MTSLVTETNICYLPSLAKVQDRMSHWCTAQHDVEWVGFCRSENVKAAARQFLYARVRFVLHTGLLNTVESMAAPADKQTVQQSPRPS